MNRSKENTITNAVAPASPGETDGFWLYRRRTPDGVRRFGERD